MPSNLKVVTRSTVPAGVKFQVVQSLYSPDLNRLGIDELEKVMKKLHKV